MKNIKIIILMVVKWLYKKIRLREKRNKQMPC